MNKAKLKNYAPQARRDFIAAVTARANQLGLAIRNGALDVASANRQGDVAIIAGREWPAKVYGQRERLIKRMQVQGFAQTVEAVAYTWFNRFAALRYLELHDYLDHGYRVLSSVASRQGGIHTPDVLLHAVDLAQSRSLPGLNAEEIASLKLAGNQDGELYRRLLIAQCNALSNAMPWLFERIDDETELLLPDNLLRTDSVISKLVSEIPEEDWLQVEIIGWLYQFYISEKKDEVIGKVVKSEDIPAATQLFTPNWIVQYLVQNSVGRLWLMANPSSPLKSQWPYYIEPAEQTPEVQDQLDTLFHVRMAEDGGRLNPESITVLDPACGSGHILVEAYEVLKAIYLERGYRLRDIPRLILEKNLYGLDIDDRAAQMAGFGLLMKARADDRKLLDDSPRLNVLALQESNALRLDELAAHLEPFGIQRRTLKTLLDTFAYAKTFGSLIQIPHELNIQLDALANGLWQAAQSGDLYAQAVTKDILPLAIQAQMLGRLFDVVVANPPYMGSNGMSPMLKEFAKKHFPDGKSDLFAMFIESGSALCKKTGFSALVTMQNWMFLPSFESLRRRLIKDQVIYSFVHIGYNSFPEINSKIALACAFCCGRTMVAGYRGTYIDLNSAHQSADKGKLFLARSADLNFTATQDTFERIPGGPIAYRASEAVSKAFEESVTLGSVCSPRKGMVTADNPRFIRHWSEVSKINICFDSISREAAKASGCKWFPYQKGGVYRKWYGNHEWVVNWKNDGEELLNMQSEGYAVGSTNHNLEYIFKSALLFSKISITPHYRYSPQGFLFDDASGLCAVKNKDDEYLVLGFLCSKVCELINKLTNPSLNLQPGSVSSFPYKDLGQDVRRIVDKAVCLSKEDWDSSEISWDFIRLPLLQYAASTLEQCWRTWESLSKDKVDRLMQLEVENNRLFINAYKLQDELTPEISETQITLIRADREKDCQALISYTIGCIMGRYSLDEPGVVYAHGGNVGFDPTRYETFAADADGIVPLTDELWFEDDAANRVREFLVVVWGAETLDENRAWLAESLGRKGSETPDETIRRYLADRFFKDHLQTYKKRPIYWLFSSGKQGAFQALVYLHRYHEGTLARMRAEYVVPLTGKIQARIEMLTKDAVAASSTAARSKLNKEIEKLQKKHVELLTYDEKLRHYADMRIQLDLDDGVKVNYGKFGDLLAEVKAVTGGAGDD